MPIRKHPQSGESSYMISLLRGCFIYLFVILFVILPVFCLFFYLPAYIGLPIHPSSADSEAGPSAPVSQTHSAAAPRTVQLPRNWTGSGNGCRPTWESGYSGPHCPFANCTASLSVESVGATTGVRNREQVEARYQEYLKMEG